jgi:chromosomal replication initiator protein
VVDYLAEIPLPGRILAPPAKNLATGVASAPLPSFIAGPENRLVAATVNRLLERATFQASLSETRLHAAAPLRDAHLRTTILALHGPSGVGKTHLAHGLVRHWQRELGDGAALYETAADFRRHYNDAIDIGNVEEFRNDHRLRRLLAIDDIHRLPDEDYLMQELRHTIDAIEENGGVIIVTSPRPALALSNLPPDIRSRFASGLSLQLAPPGSAARMRIIRHASTALGRDLSLDAAGPLAEGVSGTATQVFGALFALRAAPSTPGANEAARTEQLPATLVTRQPPLQQIITVVAKYANVPQKQLKSGARRQSLVFARAIVIYLARELTDASYDQIGRALGGRDHTTIMHNYKKINHELTRDIATQEVVTDLRRILLGR